MQVGKLVELIQTELAGGNLTKDARKKYHPAIIKERIGIFYDRLVVPVFHSFVMKKDWTMMNKLTIALPKITVEKKDSINYSELPKNIDVNNIQYLFITPQANRDISFQYVTVQQLSVYKNTFVSMVSNDIVMYYQQGNQIIYHKDPDVETVFINIIPSFTAFGMDDDAPMIQYMQEDLFNMTVQSLRGQQAVPLDLKNNANPNIITNERKQ